jgi:hypothetical protein
MLCKTHIQRALLKFKTPSTIVSGALFFSFFGQGFTPWQKNIQQMEKKEVIFREFFLPFKRMKLD